MKSSKSATSLVLLFLTLQVQGQDRPLGFSSREVEQCYRAAQAAAPAFSGLSWGDTQPCRDALRQPLTDRAKQATLVNLGLMQTGLGDFAGAAASYEEAATLGETADLYLNRANLNYLRQDYEAAIRDYGEAMRLSSEDAAILYLNRGMAYQNTGQFNLAESDYRAALSVRPEWGVVAEKLESLEAVRQGF